MLGWYGVGVAFAPPLVVDGGSEMYVALSGVQRAGMRAGEVGTGAPGVGKQYTSISDWQPPENSSTSKPLFQSSSLSQQYCVCWASSDARVSLKLAVMVRLGVALGSSVGVYQDVVKLGAAVSAGEAEIHVEKRGLVLDKGS
jgi:hypothetical protein